MLLVLQVTVRLQPPACIGGSPVSTTVEVGSIKNSAGAGAPVELTLDQLSKAMQTAGKLVAR